ncbi:MAG TPA: methyltransferase [Planctomycetaceae bacterium]
MKKRLRRDAGDRGLHTHRSEQLLIEHLDELPGGRLLCTTQGRAQFAAVAALRPPERRVTCHFLDLFRAEESRRLHGDGGGRLSLVCTADFPDEEFDAVALPFTATGEAELVRELMQTGYLRLAEGGRMAVATDNSRDSFFHEEMQKLFPKVTRIDGGRGVLYLGTRRGPLKRVRDFSTEFAFRDGDRLLKVFSRPGVFSHRRLDAGTRALLDAVEVTPGMRVLDLGCGAGPVAAALASRADGVTVEAVDSNPRAVACTQRTCELNGITAVRTHLNAEAKCGEKETLDLAAGNPPYFSQFRIAELFLDSAAEALRPGGRAVFVTKQPRWFEEHMTGRFDGLTSSPLRNYVIVSGVKPR